VAAKLRITYRKSSIGCPQRQKDTIHALGFHKLYSTIEKDDTPTVRGMIERVAHLVRVEEVSEPGATATGEQA